MAPTNQSSPSEETREARRDPNLSHSAQPHSSRSQEPWLTRGAVLIGLVSLFADISTEVMYPLLPTFITRVLGAPVAALGIIEGVANGAASIVGGFSGWLSDQIGRRKQVAFVGYVLSAISKPLIGVASTWRLVLGARFSDRFGKGIRSAPRDALLSESASPEHRGRAFGFERAMDSSGALIGPLLAVFLVGGLGFHDRTVFYVATIPASIAALLILAVPEKRSQLVRGTSGLKLTLAGTSSEYRRLLIVTAVFGLANSADAFIILRAQQLSLGLDSTILAYGLYNAVSAFASLPAGVGSDRFGRRNLLIIGYSIYALSYLGFAKAAQPGLIWPLFALYGLFPAFTDGVAKALAVDTAGKAGRATAVGVYSAVVGITQIAASYIGGELWDHIGSSATFYFGALLSAVAVALLFILLPSRPLKNETD